MVNAVTALNGEGLRCGGPEKVSLLRRRYEVKKNVRMRVCSSSRWLGIRDPVPPSP